MSNRQKPPEVIQAQVAAFLHDKEVHGRHDMAEQRYMLGNISRIAMGPLDDIVLDAATADSYNAQVENEYIPQLAVPPEDSPKTIATRAEYEKFLHERGGAGHEDIEGQAALLSAYKDFAPDVKKIKQELTAYRMPESHPAFLGGGGGSNAFTITREGKNYVVILPHSAIPQAEISSRLSGVVRAKGVPHFEQAVAASYEDGATIAEELPGKTFENLSVDDLNKVTPDQLKELIETLQITADKGIHIDFMTGNFLYDAKEGFGIIDITSSERVRRPFVDNLKMMSYIMMRMSQFQDEDIKHAFASSLKRVQLEYKKAVEDKLREDPNALAEVTASIDEYIAVLDSTISQTEPKHKKRLARVWKRNRKGHAAAGSRI